MQLQIVFSFWLHNPLIYFMKFPLIFARFHIAKKAIGLPYKKKSSTPPPTEFLQIKTGSSRMWFSGMESGLRSSEALTQTKNHLFALRRSGKICTQLDTHANGEFGSSSKWSHLYSRPGSGHGHGSGAGLGFGSGYGAGSGSRLHLHFYFHFPKRSSGSPTYGPRALGRKMLIRKFIYYKFLLKTFF